MKLFLSPSINLRLGLGYKNLLRHFLSSSTSSDILYKRISPLGDPRVSLVPILDQWVQEGRSLLLKELRNMIEQLKGYKRFKHALEISLWMSKNMPVRLSVADIGTRLTLISRVHGVEQAENYFNSLPKESKGFAVYRALLNCFVHEASWEKAEAIKNEMSNLGFTRSPVCYNILMNLYSKMGNYEKLDVLMHEMEEQGIRCDQYTYCIRLSAYAAVSDINGVDDMVSRMECDPHLVLDFIAYDIAANGYLKVGLVDKALAMLKKLEGLITTSERKNVTTSKRKNVAFNSLLKLYARVGKKSELYRVWTLYKEKENIYNKGYIIMIGSLLKFDDIEGAEKIFEEWELRKLSYDFQVLNLLIEAYCRKGLLEKSEALINSGTVKGGKPYVYTWYYMACGYLKQNRIAEAIEAIGKAISVCPSKWKPSKDLLVTCSKFLEGGDVEGASRCMEILQVDGIFSPAVPDSLVNYLKEEKPQFNGVSQIDGVVSA